MQSGGDDTEYKQLLAQLAELEGGGGSPATSQGAPSAAITSSGGGSPRDAPLAAPQTSMPLNVCFPNIYFVDPQEDCSKLLKEIDALKQTHQTKDDQITELQKTLATKEEQVCNPLPKNRFLTFCFSCYSSLLL